MKNRFFGKKKETSEVNIPASGEEAQDNSSLSDGGLQQDENNRDNGIVSDANVNGNAVNNEDETGEDIQNSDIAASEAQDNGNVVNNEDKPVENNQDSSIVTDTQDNGNSVNNETQDGSPAKVNLLKKKKPWSLKKKIIFGSVCFLAAILIGAVVILSPFWMQLIHPSLSGFKTVAEQLPVQSSVDTTTQNQSDAGTAASATNATATRDAVSDFIAQGNYAILKDKIVNILLIGVDYAPERVSWGGKHTYHSDVMIVLSINQNTNQVSLISLPRDSYAAIPGVKGIYKLNASLNCGGSWPDPKACSKVCEAASWMMGGLPIDYFYAVDMTAVKSLVDKIGGVDFNVDISFQMDGRNYKEGLQHMSGQAALDYMRVRHNEDIAGSDSSDVGDKARVNRQKNMLKAIFKKLKDTGGIFQIPNILASVTSEDFITNVPTDETIALAGYSLSINPDDVKVYSMYGPYKPVFGLDYTITDQQNRVNIIKEVYGIDITDKAQVAAAGLKVPDYSDYDWNSAHKLWLKMERSVTRKQADKMLSKIKSALDADAKISEKPADTPTVSASDTGGSAKTSVASFKTGISGAPEVLFDANRKYPSDGKEWTLYNTCVTERAQLDNGATDDLIDSIQSDITKLAGYLNIKVPDTYWNVIYNTFYGKFNQSYVHNEIKVDPR